MTILLSQPGRTLIRRWAAKESPIASGRVVSLLRVATNHLSSTFSPQPALRQSDASSGYFVPRFYATRAGRPKAHTGRAAPTKRKTTTTKSTTKSKAKPTKATKAKANQKAKPKARPKKRVLSEAGKQKAEARKQVAKIRELKKTALSTPKKLPDTAWTVFVAEQLKGSKSGGLNKALSERYQNFTLQEKEHYNHIANQNKTSNESVYKAWIQSYSAEQVSQANIARRHLKRLGKATAGLSTMLKDDRHVKQPASAYIFFCQERIRTGDLKNMKVSEMGTLLGSEWKGLTEGEKAKYKAEQAADQKRYLQEYKTIYGKDPPTLKKAKKA